MEKMDFIGPSDVQYDIQLTSATSSKHLPQLTDICSGNLSSAITHIIFYFGQLLFT